MSTYIDYLYFLQIVSVIRQRIRKVITIKHTAIQILVFLTLGCSGVTAGGLLQDDLPDNQSQKYDNHIFTDRIKTVILHREGWELSWPIMELNSNQKLVFSFDYLGEDIQDYYYTFIHCNANWQPSNLFPSEYLEGFTDNRIEEYDYSFNTTIRYIHYELILPNEYFRFKLSGNYVLHVYRNNDPEDIVISQRFAVTESRVAITITPKRPSFTSFRDSGQEIDFSISYQGYPVRNPYQDIRVAICQNNRWDNAITGLKPSFLRNQVLIYDYAVENVFRGGSEYRYFDFKSLRYQSEYVKEIDFRNDYYHVALHPDPLRTSGSYFFHEDLNGRFYVDVQEQTNRNTDADYAWVYFTLPYLSPPDDGQVYVFGGLSNWEWNDRNRMRYNPESQSYELSMLLKQGFYNYEYIFVSDREGVADNSWFEGNHFETENDYVIYVYHHDDAFRYEKLIGVTVVNTLNR